MVALLGKCVKLRETDFMHPLKSPWLCPKPEKDCSIRKRESIKMHPNSIFLSQPVFENSLNVIPQPRECGLATGGKYKIGMIME